MISKLLFEQYYLDIIVLTLGLHLHLFDALNENTSVLNLVCPTTTNEVVMLKIRVALFITPGDHRS